MNIVILHGQLASEPVARLIAGGGELWSFDLRTSIEAADGTVRRTIVPIATALEPRRDWVVGNDLAIVGTVERRFFRSGGRTQSRTEVVAAGCIAVTRRRPIDRALAAALGALGSQAAARLRSIGEG